jgi:hypothetical protein
MAVASTVVAHLVRRALLRLMLLLSSFVGPVWASFAPLATVPTPVQVYRYDISGFFLTKAEACKAYVALIGFHDPVPRDTSCGGTSMYGNLVFDVFGGGTYDSNFGRCVDNSSSSGFMYTNVGICPSSNVCPAHATLSGGSCSCNSGFDQSGSSCVPHANACTASAGQISEVNVTVGWNRSADQSDLRVVGGIHLPEPNVCYAGCLWDRVDLGFFGGSGGKGWISQTPSASGLYRLSADVSYRKTTSECSASTESTNPSSQPASCPGEVGQVNGVTVCVGTATKPIVTTNRPSGVYEPGNPSAGIKPDSGEGSGVGGSSRTPSVGDGGPGGGPAAAGGSSSAGGSGGGGTATGKVDSTPGQEQQACGAPGQPACRLDESGMPTGAGFGMSRGHEGLDGAADQKDGQLSGIASAEGKDTSWSVPSWFSAAACHPWSLAHLPAPIDRDLTVDICPIKGYIDGALSFVWLVFGFFGTLGMVFRVTTASGSG